MLDVAAENIAVDSVERCIIIRFVRPEIRNPLSIALLTELRSIVDKLSDDKSFERVIFTGTDSVFASGADLREIASVLPEDAQEFAVRGQSLMTAIASLPQMTIAAVNGYCYGGALDLALACDHRIVGANARFAHPGTALGIITGWGGTQRLPHLIGEARALEMLLTAEPIGAEEAINCGLADLISNDLMVAAVAYEPSQAI